jgi:hypothetical protein
MNQSWRWPIIGVAAAIVITSTMDATGMSAFSSLPLFPLLVFFWYLQQFSAKDIGFTWGASQTLRSYGIAILYPIVVMGAIVAIAALTGALNPAAAIHHKHSLWFNLLLVGGTTIPVALLTEEGFFSWLALGVANASRPSKDRDSDLDERRVRAMALVVGHVADRIQPADVSGSDLYAQRGSAWCYLGDAASSFRLTGSRKRQPRRLERFGLRTLRLWSAFWRPRHLQHGHLRP